MMKKNKLYTVNKWNREALGEAVEKTVPYPTENLFYVGGDVGKNVLAADRLASQLYGANYGEAGNTLNDYMNSTNAFGLSKADNPFSKMNIQGGIGAMANTGIGKGVLGAVGSVGNRLAYNTISGGLSSGAGKAVGNITNTIGGALANVNPVIGMGVQVIGGAIGGGINALGGTAVDEKKKAANDAGTAALNNFTSNAESFDDIHGPQAVANVQDAHKSGAWRKGWARRRNAADREARANAIAFADRSISNNIYNIAEDQLNDALANYSAFGGPIEQIYNDDMGAINYDFMDRYLTAKEVQNKQKNKLTGVGQLPTFMATSNTFGGGGKKDKAVKKVQEVVYDALAAPIHAIFGNPGKRGGYSGGRFGGAGVSGKWSDPTYSYNEIHPADTLFVPVTQTFNDAFADARRRGLDTFEFNGGTYGTELGDNPNWKAAGDARTRDTVIPVPIPADTIRRTSDVPRNDTIITDDAYRRYPISTSNIRETIPTGFALGGVLQNHGADWSTGLTHVNAGGTHEESPYDGVQMGVDPQGIPNLVEEGEVVWNDYVFSNRIEVPKEAQKWLGVKGKNLTFAEASKQLEKEIKERPNDPVSRAGLKAQMEKLEEEQEFVKRCTSYSIGEVYDVDNNEMSLLNHNGYEYEKLG